MKRFPELGFFIPTQAKPHNCGNPKIPALGVTTDTDEATFSLKKETIHESIAQWALGILHITKEATSVCS